MSSNTISSNTIGYLYTPSTMSSVTCLNSVEERMQSIRPDSIAINVPPVKLSEEKTNVLTKWLTKPSDHEIDGDNECCMWGVVCCAFTCMGSLVGLAIFLSQKTHES